MQATIPGKLFGVDLHRDMAASPRCAVPSQRNTKLGAPLPLGCSLQPHWGIYPDHSRARL